MIYVETKLPIFVDKIRLSSEINLKKDDLIVFSLNNAMYFSSVLNVLTELKEDNINGQVIRKALDEDIKTNQHQTSLTQQYINNITKLVNEENLGMRIIFVYVSLDKKNMTITYTANTRVDFRNLIKNIVKNYHMKIELKQIGVRDRAKIIGGYGVCGQKICCTRFLNNFDSINIGLAKKQNIALNPNKINGVCGRLLCCLKFEKDLKEKDEDGNN